MNQARFKVGEIVPALDPDDHSRFLIAPHRKLNAKEERYTIACGLLDGFGDFLDESSGRMIFNLAAAIARPSCVPLLACRAPTRSSRT